MADSILPPCEVCGAPGHAVCSSTLGPYSACFCLECLQHQAEPYWLFIYVYYEVGNRGENLAEWVRRLTTVRDGQRMTWDNFDALQREYNYLEQPPEPNWQELNDEPLESFDVPD